MAYTITNGPQGFVVRDGQGRKRRWVAEFLELQDAKNFVSIKRMGNLTSKPLYDIANTVNELSDELDLANDCVDGG